MGEVWHNSENYRGRGFVKSAEAEGANFHKCRSDVIPTDNSSYARRNDITKGADKQFDQVIINDSRLEITKNFIENYPGRVFCYLP